MLEFKLMPGEILVEQASKIIQNNRCHNSNKDREE
jgi:hypothetical protein